MMFVLEVHVTLTLYHYMGQNSVGVVVDTFSYLGGSLFESFPWVFFFSVILLDCSK
jgi:hypothetical protein